MKADKLEHEPLYETARDAAGPPRLAGTIVLLALLIAGGVLMGHGGGRSGVAGQQVFASGGLAVTRFYEREAQLRQALGLASPGPAVTGPTGAVALPAGRTGGLSKISDGGWWQRLLVLALLLAPAGLRAVRSVSGARAAEPLVALPPAH